MIRQALDEKRAMFLACEIECRATRCRRATSEHEYLLDDLRIIADMAEELQMLLRRLTGVA